MIDFIKRFGSFIAVVCSAVAGGILVFITLGSWGRKDTIKGTVKAVEGKATVEVQSDNVEADKAHADSINSALDKLP